MAHEDKRLFIHVVKPPLKLFAIGFGAGQLTLLVKKMSKITISTNSCPANTDHKFSSYLP